MTQPNKIEITDPNNVPIPKGGGQWEQQGNFLVKVLPPHQPNPEPAQPPVAAQPETEE